LILKEIGFQANQHEALAETLSKTICQAVINKVSGSVHSDLAINKVRSINLFVLRVRPLAHHVQQFSAQKF
jgi:hypothetical protein